MNTKTLLIFGIMFLTLTFVSAEDITFKVGQTADLKLYATINGSFSPTIICNATIIYPNESVMIDNKLMTNQVTFQNITLIDSQVLGKYRYIVSCKEGGEASSDAGFFYITPSGDSRGVSYVLIAAIGSLILFILALYTRNQYMGFIAGTLLIVTGVYVMIYGFNNINEMLSRSIAYVILGLGIFITISSAYEVIEDFSEE